MRGGRLLVVALVAVLIVNLGAMLTAAWIMWQREDYPTATITTYSYDSLQEQWVKTADSVELPPEPDGSMPRSTNTVVIQLKEDEPVKTIWIEEALIIGGSEPLLEIDGDSDSLGSSSEIRICNLVLWKVDAEELDIDDTEVVRVTMENVVAEDDELDLDFEMVNVVACGRGAASTLFLGVSSRSVLARIDNISAALEGLSLGAPITLGVPVGETGIRIDRLRILGPSSGDGFIENLVIVRTSVFGEIEIDDVKIKNLLLKDVTMDDDLDHS